MTIEKAFELYKRLRNKIDEVKKEVGFKCKMCGTCCTQNIPVIFEDLWFMKENGVSPVSYTHLTLPTILLV